VEYFEQLPNFYKFITKFIKGYCIKDIIKAFKEVFPNLNQNQIDAILTTEGPLLILAGLMTGKTLTLINRTLYLVISGKAKLIEIVLTTFTEKFTFEMRDRIFQVVEKIGYTEKLSDLKIGMFHNLCNDFVLKNLSSRKWTLIKKMELEMESNQRIRKIPQ
jgi:superfamily I DNA/RNA helicase